MRFIFFFILLIVSGICHSQEKPNIIVLLVDDAGYIDFGFVENADQQLAQYTPNITRLANAGAVFTNAYVSGPVCHPSRAGFLTGRYQQRFGHEMNLSINSPFALPDSVALINERLKPLGYVTGVIGKWSGGYPRSAWPKQRGWDYSFVHLRGQRNYLPIKAEPLVSVYIENNLPQKEEGYATDRVGEKAVQFIEENKDKPFFLYMSFNAVHGPLEPRPADSAIVKNFSDAKRGKYAAMMKALDDNVGLVVDKLNELGLAKKTLIVFFNDNGGEPSTGANNGDLRDSKASLYEGGIRVPWSMTWPGVIKPGTIIDEPVISLDLMPTFIKLAGGTIAWAWNLDGTDLMPLLTCNVTHLTPRALYWRHLGEKGNFAIREGSWKLVHQKSDNGVTELYNLTHDRSEKNNLASLHPEIVKALMSKMEVWNKQLIAPLFSPRELPD